MYGLHEILLLYSTLTRGKLIQKCFEGEKIITNTNFFKGMTKRRKKNNRSRPTVIFFFSKIKKSVLCDFKHNISNDHVSVVCVTVMAERDEINFSNSLKERKKKPLHSLFFKVCLVCMCVCVCVV